MRACSKAIRFFHLTDETGDAFRFRLDGRLLLCLQLEFIDQQAPHLLITEAGNDFVDVFCTQGLGQRVVSSAFTSACFLPVLSLLKLCDQAVELKSKTRSQIQILTFKACGRILCFPFVIIQTKFLSG
jgi:hypothetical protein